MKKKETRLHDMATFNPWSLFVIIGITTGTLLLVGCDDNDPNRPVSYRFIKTNQIGMGVCVYDGCEYVGAGPHGFAHKGNCTNKIHIYNK